MANVGKTAASNVLNAYIHQAHLSIDSMQADAEIFERKPKLARTPPDSANKSIPLQSKDLQV